VKRALLLLMTLTACHRAGPQTSAQPLGDAGPQPIAQAAPLPPTPTPQVTGETPAPVEPSPVAPTPVVPLPLGATPPEQWTELPDSVTSSVHHHLLLDGDRLFAGREDGLWELHWWGKPARQLTKLPVLAVEYETPQTLVWLARTADKSGPRLEVHRLDLTTHKDAKVAKLPVLHCPKVKTPLEWGPPELVATTAGVCLAWTDIPWDPQHSVRIDIDPAGKLTQAVWCGGDVQTSPGACSLAEMASGTDLPAEPTPDVAKLPYEAVVMGDHATLIQHRRVGRPPAVNSILRSPSTPFAPVQLSPSGRWRLLVGHEEQGDLLHLDLLLLDRKTGQVFALKPGPWPGALGPAELKAYPQDFQTAEHDDERWLPHSDVLLVGDLVIVPGVGAYRAGLMPR
jgi:hypothetical protein